jgi:hypothetical protein
LLDVDEDGDYKTGCTKHQEGGRDYMEEMLEGDIIGEDSERIQRWILQIVRHIQVVILQNGDNKYKEGAFEEGEVARETGDWLDLGTFDQANLGAEQSDLRAFGPHHLNVYTQNAL